MRHLIGCTGKIPYLSQNEAKNFLRRTKNANHVYHCHYFDHWHVTSMSKKLAKKILKKKFG